MSAFVYICGVVAASERGWKIIDCVFWPYVLIKAAIKISEQRT